MALKVHEYADAWPWTGRTIGARTMFMSAIVAAVYVVASSCSETSPR